MADVNTYKRCIMSHNWNGRPFVAGEVLPATDPATTQNPQWWVSLTDSDFTTSSSRKSHNWG